MKKFFLIINYFYLYNFQTNNIEKNSIDNEMNKDIKILDGKNTFEIITNCTDFVIYKPDKNKNFGDIPKTAIFESEIPNLKKLEKNILIKNCTTADDFIEDAKYITFYYDKVKKSSSDLKIAKNFEKLKNNKKLPKKIKKHLSENIKKKNTNKKNKNSSKSKQKDEDKENEKKENNEKENEKKENDEKENEEKESQKNNKKKNLLKDSLKEIYIKNIILTSESFKSPIKEGSLIPIYNPIFQNFTEIMVNRFHKKIENYKEEKIILNSYRDIIKAENITNSGILDQKNFENNLMDLKNYSRSNDEFYLRKNSYDLEEISDLSNLPKNGNFYLEKKVKNNSQSENFFDVENENNTEDLELVDLENLEKIERDVKNDYSYYYPALKLERGLMTKDTIREKNKLKNQLIRKIFPVKKNKNEHWILFFCVKTNYHSIKGKSVYMPVYLRDVFLKKDENNNYEKIFYKKEFIEKEINVNKVDKNFSEVTVDEKFNNPPFLFEGAFIVFEDFLEILSKTHIRVYFK